jgi:hypothetical protein
MSKTGSAFFCSEKFAEIALQLELVACANNLPEANCIFLHFHVSINTHRTEEQFFCCKLHGIKGRKTTSGLIFSPMSPNFHFITYETE